MAFWFGFCAWTVVLAPLAGVCHPSAALPGPVMFALGMGMTQLAAGFARDDRAWLSGAIRLALSAPVSDDSPVPRPPVQQGNARTPLTFFCLGSGVIVIIWARWRFAQRMYFHR